MQIKYILLRSFAAIGALLGWFAVIAQFYLLINNSPGTTAETVFRFFGYFTIDTNILTAICLSFIAFKSNSKTGIFFSKAGTVTAITVYIMIAGIVYNVILRSLWAPEGLQKIVDELLHSIIPVLLVLIWVFFIPIEELKWKMVFGWLVFPLLYMIYALILGAVTKFYPYPFVDVNELGYQKALLNAGGILLVIFLFSLALVGTGKMMKRFDKK